MPTGLFARTGASVCETESAVAGYGGGGRKLDALLTLLLVLLLLLPIRTSV